MKRQVILIHGGEIFENEREYLTYLTKARLDVDKLTGSKKRKWKETLREKLGRNFEVLYPEMPNNRWNDRYVEWKIWFERIIPFIKNGGIFVGHSLGGIFLAKYFSENVFPKKVRAIILAAAPYENKKKGRPNYFGGFVLKKDLSLMTRQAKDIYLFQSEDDPLVPFSQFKEFQKYLPTAHSIAFKDRGHFISTTFPEMVKTIRSIK